jgi:SAM-dependent methyltransferase
MSHDNKNWFDQGGITYAAFRPEYPVELASFLVSLTADKELAVDVGCGNGQLTTMLAPFFSKVIGFDPSADQIANCQVCERVRYQCAPAENLPLPDKCAGLVTAAQAAHWFDLPKFYAEVRRIGTQGGILALVSYGVLTLDDSHLNDLFQQFYWQEIGVYWPPERKLVDTGYATIDFPFDELESPAMAIRLKWNLSEFLGYLSTWSAVRHAKDLGRDDVLHGFAASLAGAWGDPSVARSVVWPINMRIGRF